MTDAASLSQLSEEQGEEEGGEHQIEGEVVQQWPGAAVRSRRWLSRG